MNQLRDVRRTAEPPSRSLLLSYETTFVLSRYDGQRQDGDWLPISPLA